MGVETRKPPLPAPTESSTVQTSGDSVVGTDLATDLSRRTDRTSYSIPEDGSPITIPTKKNKDHKERGNTLTRGSKQSQTSLLIEYFEGGKGPNPHSRPSVRVKVTPSAARKIRDTNEHIQITEAGGTRKPSYTRRISLGGQTASEQQQQSAEGADDRSISSYTSAAEESSLAGRRPPVEIEVLHKDQGSDLSGASAPQDERYMQQATSDISSMPPDSMLEGTTTDYTSHRRGSRASHREVLLAENTLRTPPRTKDRSVSRDRITQKVMEKLEGRPRDISGKKHRHGSKTRSGSVSEEQILESGKSPRRRSSRHRAEDEFPSGAESSLLTTSQLSPKRQSGDQYSFRSGTSQSSLNNPKLLQTVEDAIRRLILPELTALKHEQKSQQNRTNFERENRGSVGSGSTNSRGEVIRRVSKHASAPDVSGKPKVVLNQDETNPGIVLSGDSLKGRKEYRRDEALEYPLERSSDPTISEETIIRDDGTSFRRRSKDRHRVRNDAAAGAVGGVLTAAALRNHDSRSSIDRQERRRKRSSKSRSRSASLAAESTEEIFQRHDVPPMPLRSDINESELTRDSILSERTENPSSPSSDRRRTEIRQVSRGSPREVLSPIARTPTRTPVALQRGIGTHHSNHSRGDLTVHSTHSDRSIGDEQQHARFADIGISGTATGAGVPTSAHLLNRDGRYDEPTFNYRAQNRGLSPIQSVASYDEDAAEHHNRHSLHHGPSSASISSLGQERHKGAAVSIKSLSSAASTDLARSRRPQGINLEGGDEVLDQHGLGNYKSTEDEGAAMETWYNEQHEENDRYRDSFDTTSRDPTVDYKHMTNYTDDSLDAPDLDKVTAAHQVHEIGANPEYIHTPLAVESAVASLHDPSVLDVSTRSARSKAGARSYSNSLNDAHREGGEYSEVSDRGLGINEHGGDMKQYNGGVGYEPGLARKIEHRIAGSPRQSIARSMDEEEERVTMGASGLPLADDPMPEIGHGLNSDESDINTNPSIIQGPIGGPPNNNLDHWPYNPTPPESKGDILGHSQTNSAHESLKAAAAGMLSAAALAAGRDRVHDDKGHAKEMPQYEYGHGVNHDFGPIHDSYMAGQTIPTPPMAKDEGYISAANPRSPVGLSPLPKTGGPRSFDDDSMAGDDPFMDQNHVRHLSGYSQGMDSPLYDSATGKGMDRIQSKDIVALMDHLTVRDARRNARDTEILVTLVRSAAEMRNSFEGMKRFIAEQDEMLIDIGSKQHDRTAQKIINGPRPQPLGNPRTPRHHSTDDDIDDIPTKRRNVFKRALKGLSMRSSNDLGKIEDMLVQLLGEVQGLKAAQDGRPSATGAGPDSLNSYDNLRTPANDGYEPEGQAGTSSTPNHSGYFSNSSLQQGNGPRGYDGRRGSQNRVSTVLEGDEELDEHEQNLLDHQFENNEKLLTPTQELQTPTQELRRGDSMPLDTPPQVHVPTGAQSSEHTPKNGTDKSRKHKSSSSSFFPKISRWSKTTASSVGDNFRGNGRRERPFSEASRSGSDININPTEHYSPQSDDRLRSSDSFKHHPHDSLANSPRSAHSQENRPPSPLVPSQVSEDPKYQAHRNSLNLQHPQPRQGPTHRYQTHLESQAQNFTGSPISPSSDQFGSNPTLARFAPLGPGNRYSGNLAGHLSPISDTQSEASAANERRSTSGSAPPRPPKVRDDGPLVPQRPPKLETEQRGAYGSPRIVERLATVPEGSRYSNGSAGYEQANGSPRSASGQRGAKLAGPRPIGSSGSWSPDKGQAMGVSGMKAVKKHKFRGSPNYIEGDSEEDVTF